MRRWEARLEGGPFDGDEGSIDKCPKTLWVVWVEGCADTEWFGAWCKGGEVYTLEEENGYLGTARYVHRDTKLEPTTTRIMEEALTG